MKTGNDIVELALTHIGEKYVFGSRAPKDNKNYRGPWDCAEYGSYLVYQIAGVLYGCYRNSGSPSTADAFTGYWKRDAETLGIIISIDEAKRTPGAFLLRYAANGIVGHLAASDGKGGTVEAHSTKTGVIKSKVDGRRWDIGVLVPQISYTAFENVAAVKEPTGKIYRLTSPQMRGDAIKAIQEKLGVKIDGIFGNGTYNAVKKFQIKAGLVPDGEVGSTTAKALKIDLKKFK